MPTRPPAETADPYADVPMSPSLRALVRRGELVRRRKGQMVINEGDLGDTIYVVLSGGLRAFSVGADDQEFTFSRYGPGDYVGEMGLDDKPRSANVEATQATVCAMITRATLRQHLKADPDFAFELLTKVTGIARSATNQARDIALKPAYVRLREELQRLAQRQPDGHAVIEPAPSHRELSQTIGCARETVTRFMKALVQGGYVRAGRGEHRIEILKSLPSDW